MPDQAVAYIELRRAWTDTQRTVENIAETVDGFLNRFEDANSLLSSLNGWLINIELRLSAMEKLLDEIAKKSG